MSHEPERGDGLADMIQVRSNEVDIWLNAIGHFKPRAIISQSCAYQKLIRDENGIREEENVSRRVREKGKAG